MVGFELEPIGTAGRMRALLSPGWPDANDALPDFVPLLGAVSANPAPPPRARRVGALRTATQRVDAAWPGGSFSTCPSSRNPSSSPSAIAVTCDSTLARAASASAAGRFCATITCTGRSSVVIQVSFGARPCASACRAGRTPAPNAKESQLRDDPSCCALAMVSGAGLTALSSVASGQVPAAAPARTILAIGAHAGDAELTTGLLLAKQRRLGDRTVILHLTLGEGGNPKLSPEAYGEQKRREALAVAAALRCRSALRAVQGRPASGR